MVSVVNIETAKINTLLVKMDVCRIDRVIHLCVIHFHASIFQFDMAQQVRCIQVAADPQIACCLPFDIRKNITQEFMQDINLRILQKDIG